MPKRITIRNIRRLEIRTRRLVNDLFAGRYHSSFKGRGMTFSSVCSTTRLRE